MAVMRGNGTLRRDRAIAQPADAEAAIDALCEQTRVQLNWRGEFDSPAAAQRMSPAPAPNDVWVVRSPAKLYIQLAHKRGRSGKGTRERIVLSGVLEDK